MFSGTFQVFTWLSGPISNLPTVLGAIASALVLMPAAIGSLFVAVVAPRALFERFWREENPDA